MKPHSKEKDTHANLVILRALNASKLQQMNLFTNLIKKRVNSLSDETQ